MGFSRQEYWSGSPFPSPRDLPDPGIEPGSPPLQADRFFPIWATAAAAAKSPQSCLTLCDPIDSRLPRPWGSPGKNTGVGCHFLLQCVKVKSLSHVWLLAPPWTAAYQAPPSMGFFQARVLEWVAIAFCIWATREAQNELLGMDKHWDIGCLPGILFLASYSELCMISTSVFFLFLAVPGLSCST